MPKVGKSKKPAAAPYDPSTRKTTTSSKNSLFEKRPRAAFIGGALRPGKRDLSRYVKWPRYVRLQRQERILKQRLKVPPTVNQFRHTLDKTTTRQAMRLLKKYQPETRSAKKERLTALAEAKASGKAADAGKKPLTIKYGINHIAGLCEQKKAALVLIAHDVDPLELVLWLPALCRKNDIPYAIVKGKAVLGKLVHKKNATAVALTGVRAEDKSDLASLTNAFKSNFNERFAELRRRWGGGIMGHKSQMEMKRRAAILAKEQR